MSNYIFHVPSYYVKSLLNRFIWQVEKLRQKKCVHGARNIVTYLFLWWCTLYTVNFNRITYMYVYNEFVYEFN